MEDTVADLVAEQEAELVAQPGQRVEHIDVPGLDQRAGDHRQGAEPAGSDLHAQAGGHDLLELVSLVEDDHVVLG